MNYVYMYLFMYNNILCDHLPVNALSALIGFISFTLHAMCNIKGPEGLYMEYTRIFGLAFAARRLFLKILWQIDNCIWFMNTPCLHLD